LAAVKVVEIGESLDQGVGQPAASRGARQMPEGIELVPRIEQPHHLGGTSMEPVVRQPDPPEFGEVTVKSLGLVEPSTDAAEVGSQNGFHVERRATGRKGIAKVNQPFDMSRDRFVKIHGCSMTVRVKTINPTPMEARLYHHLGVPYAGEL
jgi:hypothetical protein